MFSIWIACLFLTFISSGIECGILSAQIGKIKSLSITNCEVTGTPLDVQTNFYNINDKGDKALDVDLDLSSDIEGKDYRFQLDVARWEGNSWREGMYNVEGELCDYIQKYIPDLWGKLTAALEPPNPNVCTIKAGKYKLRKFEASTKDIRLPSILYGKFKLTFKVYSPNDEEVMCKEYQAESSN